MVLVSQRPKHSQCSITFAGVAILSTLTGGSSFLFLCINIRGIKEFDNVSSSLLRNFNFTRNRFIFRLSTTVLVLPRHFAMNLRHFFHEVIFSVS